MGIFDFEEDVVHDIGSDRVLKKPVTYSKISPERGFLRKEPKTEVSDRSTSGIGGKVILAIFVAVIVFSFVFIAYHFFNGDSIFRANEEPDVRMDVQYGQSQFIITLSSKSDSCVNVHAKFSGYSEMPIGNGFDNSDDWVISKHQGTCHEYISKDIYVKANESFVLREDFVSEDSWNISFIPEEIISTQIKVVEKG